MKVPELSPEERESLHARGITDAQIAQTQHLARHPMHPGGSVQDGPWLNPDCWNGKHSACAGDAWNTAADAPTECECSCHGNPA
jgi:hypothetical protein